MIDFTDIQILHPQQGHVLTIPISPGVTLQTPTLRVLDVDVEEDRARGSLTLGVPHGSDGARFCDDVVALESFLKLGTATMWNVWYKTCFEKMFMSVVRESSSARYAAEVKLSFVHANKLNIVDEAGAHIAVQRLLGQSATLSLSVTGLWCSEQRCGPRCTIKSVHALGTPPGCPNGGGCKESMPCLLD